MSTHPAHTKASQSLGFDQRTWQSRHPQRIPASSAEEQTDGTLARDRGQRDHTRHSDTPRVVVQPPSGSEGESDDLHTAKRKGEKKQNVEQFHESLSPSRRFSHPKSNLGDYSEPETGSDDDITNPRRDMYRGRRPPTPPHLKEPSNSAAVVHEYQWDDDEHQVGTVYSKAALSRWSNKSQPFLDLPARRVKQGLARARQMSTFELDSARRE